ncbi:hypothetical protein LPB138_12175 [Urechidicola croceus]|uniref:Glutamate dehydrogenase n=1 Tax=Urechidicola croceus TaxID=1850246 RepID=A0A1D8PBX6_9FLAO|nr:hypothetical protein LPB138_12175 [Urechidicola croceus]
MTTASAQNWSRYGNNSHEIGFMTGSTHFTTDYGERYLFKSNVGGNVGIGFGIIHYLTFTDYRYRWNQRTSYWADHFRLRNELSYFSADLDHFGKYVDESNVGEQADKLRAMHGKARVINIGTQLEFHFVNITDFGSRRDPDLTWSPYLSLGILGVFSNPELISEYGDGDWNADQNILYEKWAVPGAVNDDAQFIFSATAGVGTRLKIGEYSDVFIESKWQYYFSNWVDALNAKVPTTNTIPNNKYNDWNVFLHVGYIYYLN